MRDTYKKLNRRIAAFQKTYKFSLPHFSIEIVLVLATENSIKKTNIHIFKQTTRDTEKVQGRNCSFLRGLQNLSSTELRTEV